MLQMLSSAFLVLAEQVSYILSSLSDDGHKTFNVADCTALCYTENAVFLTAGVPAQSIFLKKRRQFYQ